MNNDCKPKQWFMLLATVIFFSICVCFMKVFAEGMPQDNPREVNALNQAIQAGIDGNYVSGAKVLADFLAANPDTKNEDIFSKLVEFYDKDLMEYEKAVGVYQMYAKAFPQGRYLDIFSKRHQYLEKNRTGWDLLKKYDLILFTYSKRTQTENIQMMEQLLNQNPAAFLAADMDNWLAYQYFQIPQYDTSIKYMERYFANIPESQKSESTEAANYVLYAEALSKLHQFDEAKKVLSMHVNFNDPGIQIQYNEGISWVLKEQRIWIVFVISLCFIAFCVLLLILLQFWKSKEWLNSLKSVVFWMLPMVITVIICVITIYLTKKQFFNLFIYFAISQTISILFVRLLSYISHRMKRPVYYMLCFLITLCFLYLPFYLADNLSIFWSPIEYM